MTLVVGTVGDPFTDTELTWVRWCCDYCSNESAPCLEDEEGRSEQPAGWAKSPHPSGFPLDWCPECARDLEEEDVA